MEMVGIVSKSFVEERELVGKDGSKRLAKVAHVLMMVGEGAALEVVNLRCYDPTWALPDVGKKWTTPRIRKYENFDGTIAEVSV